MAALIYVEVKGGVGQMAVSQKGFSQFGVGQRVLVKVVSVKRASRER